MPSTIVTEEIELIHSDKGPGGGGFSGDGGDGGDSDSSGGAGVPQRAYVTGMFIALAGILMFFMAFVSAYIVRKDMPNSAWVPLRSAAHPVAQHFDFDRQQLHARARTQPLHAKDDEGFRHWWATTTILGILFVAGQILAWRQLAAAGTFPGDESQQQLLLRFHRGARCALARRNSGAALRAIPRHAKSRARHGDRSRLHVLAFHGWAMGLLVSTPLPGKVKRE